MTCLPIVLRELRLEARNCRSYYSRCGMVALAAIMSLGFMRWTSGAGNSPATVGSNIFWAFSTVAFAFSALAGPLVTADCLSAEKREGTLGLLFLTDLRGYDVVLGKLVSTSLPVFYCLVAAIPILALPFFFGGITPGEFWRMTVALLTTLFFSLSAGILISSISWDGRRAFVAATAFIALAALGPLSVSYFGLAPRTIWAALITAIPGPGQIFFAVKDSQYAIMAGTYWPSVTGLVLVSAGFLILAGFCLPRAWRQGVTTRAAAKPWSRKRSKRKLAGLHPVAWLAERTAVNPLVSQAFWVLVGLVWILSYEAIRHRLMPLRLVMVAIYAMHAAVKCWAAWEASRRFADDKRSGALELLLTTPLGERQILVRLLIGLKRRFLFPIAILLVLDLHLWWSGDRGEWLLALVPTMGLFVADTYTICWVGLWMGLSAKTSAQAFFRTVFWVLVFPWIVTFTVLAFSGLIGNAGNFGDMGILATGWFLVGYILDFGYCAWGIHRLSDDFRVIASKQYEPRRSTPKLPPFKPYEKERGFHASSRQSPRIDVDAG